MGRGGRSCMDVGTGESPWLYGGRLSIDLGCETKNIISMLLDIILIIIYVFTKMFIVSFKLNRIRLCWNVVRSSIYQSLHVVLSQDI